MCGIAGAIYKEGNVVPFLIKSLEVLDSRGYDGYGIGLSHGQVFKSGPKDLSRLMMKLAGEHPTSTIGVAHNRWATKGEANKVNAHPHAMGPILVVHNGDIANYGELREKLQRAGYHFLSDTDTEVFAALVDYHRRELPFFEAVKTAIGELDKTSTFAFLVLDRSTPNQMIAACQGSRPILYSVAEGKTYIASEEVALNGFVNSYQQIREGEMIQFAAGEILRTENFAGNSEENSKMYFIDSEHYIGVEKKYPFWMEQEIMSSVEVVRNAIGKRATVSDGIVLGGLSDPKIMERLSRTKRFILAGCGTSYHSAEIIADTIEELSGVQAEAVIASEAIYKKPVFNPKTTTLIAISQSGETADLVRLMAKWKPTGMLMLGIVNVPNTQITRLTDAGIYCHIGREVAVASTKAFLGQVVCGAMLAVFLADQRNKLDLAERKSIISEILALPDKVAEVLEEAGKIKSLSYRYANADNFLFIGRKYNAHVANEGALKLKEITWNSEGGINALGLPSGEMKHGTLAMIDQKFPVFAIMPYDSVFKATLNNVEEIQARNAPIIAITTDDVPAHLLGVKDVIVVPKTLEFLSPVLTVIPTQLFAYYSALERGCDPDRPRHLAKAVTVE